MTVARQVLLVLRLIHMYLAAESEAKVVYKEPLLVIDDYFL